MVKGVMAKVRQDHENKRKIPALKYGHNPSIKEKLFKNDHPKVLPLLSDSFGLADKFLGRLAGGGNFIELDKFLVVTNLTEFGTDKVTFTSRFFLRYEHYPTVEATTNFPQGVYFQ